LSLREPKKCYGRIGTSVQEFKHEELKRQEKTWASLSIDPLAIATAGIIEMEAKHHPSKKGHNPCLIGSTGVENKREEEWSPYPFDQPAMEQTTVG